MIKLYHKETNALLGEITEAQLRFLRDQLEEESLQDVDYYINEATLDMFAGRGADNELLELLRQALGTRKEMEIFWSQE